MALELQRKGYPRKPRLTQMQIRFFSLWAVSDFDPSKKRECMDLAGYSGKTPASAVIDSDRVTKNFKIEMQAQGISVVKMVEKLSELLEAKHPNPNYTIGKGEKKVRSPDNKTQRESLELALKMASISQTQKVQIDKTVDANIHHDVTIKKLREIEEDIGEALLTDEEEIIDIVPEEEDGDTDDSDIKPL